jgi:hypothetical protein
MELAELQAQVEVVGQVVLQVLQGQVGLAELQEQEVRQVLQEHQD